MSRRKRHTRGTEGRRADRAPGRPGIRDQRGRHRQAGWTMTEDFHVKCPDCEEIGPALEERGEVDGWTREHECRHPGNTV